MGIDFRGEGEIAVCVYLPIDMGGGVRIVSDARCGFFEEVVLGLGCRKMLLVRSSLSWNSKTSGDRGVLGGCRCERRGAIMIVFVRIRHF